MVALEVLAAVVGLQDPGTACADGGSVLRIRGRAPPQNDLDVLTIRAHRKGAGTIWVGVVIALLEEQRLCGEVVTYSLRQVRSAAQTRERAPDRETQSARRSRLCRGSAPTAPPRDTSGRPASVGRRPRPAGDWHALP